MNTGNMLFGCPLRAISPTGRKLRSDKPRLPWSSKFLFERTISFSALSNSPPVALIGRVYHDIDTERIRTDKYVRSNAPKLNNVSGRK